MCVHILGVTLKAVKIGAREFRMQLATYIESQKPLAITRHGETIGYYIPTRPKPKQSDIQALRKAGTKLDKLIAASGAKQEEMVQEFKELRRHGKRKKAK